ncbi:MAG TPA: hypothetical protein VET66_00175 [Steroidobacteraceae bacterium]|nr:hypothetical protein [Steroidobacteraceae bacterium]
MRFAVPLLACALAGAAPAALADPPPAAASPSAAPAATATPATPPSPATPAPAATAPTPAIAHASAAAADEAEAAATEKRLRTAGYKPQTVNGVKVWCRTENSIGSRLAQQKNCGTAQDLERSVRETQDRFEATQRRQWRPTNH